MSGNYIEDTALTGINSAFEFIATALLAKGWTRVVLNSDTSIPTTAYRVTREEHFESPGDADHAGGVHVGMMIQRDGNDNANSITFWTYLGQKVADIASISTTGTLVEVTTTGAHGFTTGDVVAVNGTDEPLFHIGDANQNETNMATITVTGGTTFQYTQFQNIGVQSGTGGKAVAMFNIAGSRSTSINHGERLTIADADVDIFGYVDEHRFGFLSQQGGSNIVVYCGVSGRDHVQTAASSTAKSTEAITGTGNQTITLDRTPTNMYDGQTIWIISPDSSTVEVATLTTIAGDQLTANFSNAFSSGAIIGQDPLPGLVMARSGVSSTTTAIGNYDVYMCLGMDGTRNGVALTDGADDLLNWEMNPVQYVDAKHEASTDPDAAGFYHGSEFSFYKNGEGVRRFATGFTAWPKGVQNEYDIHRVGPTVADDDFRVFVSQSTPDYFLGIGPGAE